MTTLRLYNTLTRTKEDFAPLDPTNVRMYVCGPTVYDYAHIGNARPAIVFDVLFRLLRHVYGPDHVTYVRNITDIDDKINARALERRGDRNVPILDVVRELTEETYGVYRDDVTALGCLAPSAMPRATENIAPMIAMTKTLIGNGHAYEAAGHVLFDVSSKPDYGKLSRRSTDDMIAGARVDVAPYKKNPMDFVLWKPSDANTPGWDSPWGRGRPGWHLECSAMIQSTFPKTDTIDIHGGGIDLVFPHHENEIAQSEGAHHDHPLAKVWMHNGFLNVEGEKMSKSLGNFVTIRELLDSWPGDALRLNMLRTNYNQPMDWTHDGMVRAMTDLRSWSELIALELGEDVDLLKLNGSVDSKLVEELSDNLNTHMALSRLDVLYQQSKAGKYPVEDFAATGVFLGFRNLNKPGYFDLGFAANTYESGPQISDVEEKEVISYRAAVANAAPSSTSFEVRSSKLLDDLAKKGFVIKINEAGVVFVGNKTGADVEADLTARVEAKIAARNAARKAKDFKESDRIRDELLAQGIVLKDGPQGTTWEVKR
ncbi:MAG TPA: cysteine--tRNA ligase [Rhizomicrobium sp.]|jgi:cysteinyl-tRNA synthetase